VSCGNKTLAWTSQPFKCGMTRTCSTDDALPGRRHTVAYVLLLPRKPKAIQGSVQPGRPSGQKGTEAGMSARIPL